MYTFLQADRADSIGAIASGLCLIHCLATPFLFVAKSCSTTCCSAAPAWWLWFDFAFLFVAFFAVYRSTKTTTKPWISYVLWASWIALASVIFNEQVHLVSLNKYVSYIPAISLVVFHLYNLKYCQCKNDKCCAH